MRRLALVAALTCVLAACGSGGGDADAGRGDANTDANAGTDSSKCNYGWLSACQSDADCWGPGYVCAWTTTNQKVPKHCTTKCSTDSDCTGYDGCSLYMTSHHSCVLQTGVCLYF
jgi:hypothetical protein